MINAPDNGHNKSSNASYIFPIANLYFGEEGSWWLFFVKAIMQSGSGRDSASVWLGFFLLSQILDTASESGLLIRIVFWSVFLICFFLPTSSKYR